MNLVTQRIAPTDLDSTGFDLAWLDSRRERRNVLQASGRYCAASRVLDAVCSACRRDPAGCPLDCGSHCESLEYVA